MMKSMIHLITIPATQKSAEVYRKHPFATFSWMPMAACGQGPSNSKASESGEIKKVAAIQAIIAQSQYGTLQRVGNSYWDACKKFANTVLSGNNGGLSDQEVMDTLVNEITASAVK